MNRWIAEFELEDGDTMPEHMDLEYKGARIDFHCRPLEQAPQSFKWCTDCKEYDQEKHCCHRYSKVIRNTVAEIEQEPKTGHWIGIDEEPHEDYECDKCGYIISTYTANIEPHTEYKYCPNCGCRMVEPQESENV